MLKECCTHACTLPCRGVLILILMEHAQRVKVWRLGIQSGKEVLILILMEHAQRATELSTH